MPPNVLQLAEQLRAGLEAQDTAVLNRLIQSYRAIDARLQDKIDLLLKEIAELENPTATKIRTLKNYRELMAKITLEMTSYQRRLAVEIEDAAVMAIQLGLRDGRLMAAASGAKLATWKTPSMGAVEQAISFLQKDGALYKRIEQLAPFMAERISEALITSIATGAGPIAAARELVDVGLGQGMSAALNMTRTVTNWTYREANRASYIANEDVVPGWIWYAREDMLTCLSCMAMHGTEHTNDEVLDDHYNGRCMAVPMVVGFANPMTRSGEEYFNSLSEAEQREIMGAGKWDAWKSGKFTFADLTEEKPDEVYGMMRTVPSLAKLLGEE